MKVSYYELISFLDNDRPEVQILAAEHVSGLSEDPAFLEFIKSDLNVLRRIIPKIENNLVFSSTNFRFVRIIYFLL